MSKKLFIILLACATTLHTNYAMELIGMDIKPHISLDVIDGTFEINESDYGLLENYSITMKDYQEDTKEELKKFKLTKNSLTTLINYLSMLDSNKEKLLNQLKTEKNEDLNIGLQAADYLNIPDLVTAITDELATRFNSAQFISQFKKNPAILKNLKLYPQINNAIAKKILEKNSPVVSFLKSQLKFPIINNASITDTVNKVFAINPKNTIIAFGAPKVTESKTIKAIVNLYDIVSGTLIHTIDDDSFGNSIYGLSFSPDGTMLGIADRASFYLYNATTYKPIKQFDSDAFTVAFTSDSKNVAFSDGATVNIWDFEQQNIIFTDAPVQEGILTNLIFSPNNEFLAGSFGHTFINWNLGIINPLIFPSSALGHNIAYTNASESNLNSDRGPFIFTPDSSEILVGLKNGAINIHSLFIGFKSKTSLTGREGINSLCFSSDQSLLASANDFGVDIFDWQTKKQLFSLSSDPVWFATFNKINTKLITVGAGQKIQITIYDLSPISGLLNYLNNLQTEQIILLLLIYKYGSAIINENQQLKTLFESLPQSMKTLFTMPTAPQGESFMKAWWGYARNYFMKK
ncbi:hypothetical protein HYX58_03405 [Candidatus Dependentiae bacterium]|nr:hypothetical protein [Candidatus Dependentiae bacterium]